MDNNLDTDLKKLINILQNNASSNSTAFTGIDTNNEKLKINLSSAKNYLAEFNAELRGLRSIREVNNAVSQFHNAIDGLSKKLKGNSADIKAARAELEAMKRESLEQARVKNDRDLDRALSNIGSKTASKLANMGRGMTRFGDGVQDAYKVLGKDGSLMSKLAGGIAGQGRNLSKFAGKASPYLMVLDLVDKTFAKFINHLLKYKSMNMDSYLRSINAETKLHVANLNAVQSAIKNSIEGATEATYARIDAEKGLALSQAETILAQNKLTHSYFSWVPFVNSYMKYIDESYKMETDMLVQEITLIKDKLNAWENFNRASKEGYLKMDAMQKAYQRAAGIPEESMNALRDHLFTAGLEIAKFGKTQEDLIKSRTNVLNVSRRNREWSLDDSRSMMAVGALVGQETMDQVAGAMEVFNKSVSSSADLMLRTYKSAHRLGVSADVLTKNILNNLKLAEKYDFKDGVEGLIKATKWAETARANMNSIASVSEKIQSSGMEGILKMTAQMQVLGGRALMNANPFSFMYDAANDLEALGKTISDSLGDVGTFNNKRGELDFSGFLSNQRLRGMAQALGLSLDELKNMARAEDKKIRISNAVTSNFDEDEISQITNRAEWDKERREFVVKLKDGVAKSVSDLTSDDLRKIDTRKGEEIATATMTATEKIAMITEEINIKLAMMGGLDEFYRHVGETNRITKTQSEVMLEDRVANERLMNRRHEDNLDKSYSDIRDTGKELTKLLSKLDYKLKQLKLGFKERDNYGTKRGNVQPKQNVDGGIVTPIVDWFDKTRPKSSEVRSVNDGVIYRDGKITRFDSEDDVFAAKQGGPLHRTGLLDGLFSADKYGYQSYRKNNVLLEPNNSLINKTSVIKGGEVGIGSIDKRLVHGGVEREKTPKTSKSDKIDVSPIEIDIRGSLNLNSNGQSVDIISLLKTDMQLQKELARLISREMSKTLNGGKMGYDGGRFYQ